MGGGLAFTRVVLGPLAWLAGLALQVQQGGLWPAAHYAALTVLALLAALITWRGSATWRVLCSALALATLGFASTGLRAGLRLADTLPPALEGQDLEVTGVVARLPQSNLAGTRFLFEVESARQQGRTVALPELLSLGWYRGPDADALLLGPEHELRAGERWRFTVRLRQPHGNLNPHGFDFELWLFEQGVGATGYVRSRAGTLGQRLDAAAAHPVERLRQRVREAIDTQVRDAAAAGVLAALAIGDQGAIDRADWELFRLTGVAHLMSISGLHVTMFAWLAGLLIGRAWRWVPWLMLRCPAPVAARWGGLLAAAGYALLAGWGVPAQRTVWMIAVVVLLRSLGLRWPQALVLLAAAFLVTVLDPWALLQPGFWLSFVAVAMLMASDPVLGTDTGAAAGNSPLQRVWGVLRSTLRTQAIATIGLTPLTLVFFQQVSVVGFVANLLAIPLVTLVITPLALLGIALPALWALDAQLVAALLAVLRGLADTPVVVWSAAAAPPWAVACALAGGALAVMPLPWRLRACGLALMLPLLAPVVERPPPGRFELVALDIGQGTAVLVRTRTRLLLYDTGPQYSRESDAGQRVLLPLLRGRGETGIDQLMLSHRDSDHTGGAASLLGRVAVHELRSSLGPDHPLRTFPVPHERCEAGQRWRWDGVDFEVLHPSAAELDSAVKPNAVSCVLRIQGETGSVLLTGDIEAAQEAALLQRSGSALRSDVLVVPHHGSRTSSSSAFIDAVAPRVAVVQAGYRSRFGHPAADVVQRYVERGIAVVRSDLCGAWTLDADAVPACERDRAARYWHHGATKDGSGAPP